MNSPSPISMDKDTPSPEAMPSALPTGAVKPVVPPVPKAQGLTTYVDPATLPEARGRAGVFAQLVKDDGDIAGLVAYSIYKQHKLDWLRAFESLNGRAPNEAELESYFIGEGTPRRIATYRHLAEATLAGHGPDGGEHRSSMAEAGRRRATGVNPMAPSLLAVYGLIAVLFVLGFWLALHFTMTSR